MYRWWLERRLMKNERIMIFVGLNPSKASFSLNDQTLKRLISSCYSWGYGSLIVINLFARVSSSPSLIRKCSDPIGERNDKELYLRTSQWSKNPLCDLWLGWGNHGDWKSRNIDVINLVKKNAIDRNFQYPFARGPLALGLTKRGHPLHPLYISHKDGLKPFQLI